MVRCKRRIDIMDGCQCEHSSNQVGECIGCGKEVCPLCTGTISSAYCDDCAAQEMVDTSQLRED